MAKILVVDPDSVTRALLVAMLRQEHEVVEVEDGLTAIAMVQTNDVDIVIADIHMPGMNGFETAAAIKRSAGDRLLPVLLMTASADESLLAAGLQSGAEDVLVKPLSPVLVQGKILALLRTRRLFEATQRQTKELAGYRAHVEGENSIARKVFESITRGQVVDLSGVAMRSFAMDTFSGDLVLIHHMEDGRLRMLLGDFSGHGLSAAIGAIPVADVFYAMCRRDLPVPRIAVELNAKLHRSMPRNIFLSVCIAELDIENLVFTVFNAGVPDVLLVSKEGRITKRIGSNSVPLGILPAEKFGVTLQRVDVEQGDRILICSDGVLETLNPEDQFLGEERFNEVVEKANDASWLESIVQQLDDFRQNAERADDVTLMTIQCDAPLRNALLADRNNLERTELSLDMRYGTEALRDEVALDPFVNALEAYPPLSRHSGELYAVMSELFSNALEHGILRLSSNEKADAAGFLRYYQARAQGLSRLKQGEIRMSLRVTSRGGNRMARVRVEDSGPGLRPENRTPGAPEEGTLSGRGLAMVKSLCQRLSFSDAGAVVEADYLLDGDPAVPMRNAKGDVPDSYTTVSPGDSL